MSFCYWTIGDNDHAILAKSLVASARRVGVTEDFHVWTDITEVPGASVHEAGIINHNHYMFKFDILREQVKKLDYDYYVFLDADCFFVRVPPPWEQVLRDNKWFVQMENDCTSPFVKRGDWWGCPIRFWPQTLHYKGVTSKKVYNTNAGMFVVKRDHVDEFCDMAFSFFSYCRNELRLQTVTEEVALAYVGHFVDNTDLNTLACTQRWWASEWNGKFFSDANRILPSGQPWKFEDYMTGEEFTVNPAICHLLRAKETLKATV
jgi:hypothetical protein